ncbi:RTL1 [Branchiostoma lanceolatum]|uniref:Gypsy retrotransposon integrase-like protein 1 n=1 Tax=Branchiostoma lanceolatum TaxID=7740 RepID=A0A8J9ZFB2_BRALA|nr:RTL1 [Branchiostoma lanceolatum]
MAEGYSLKPPSALDVHSRNLSVTWKRWKEEMTLYLDLTVDDAVKKKKTFLYVIGEDARKVYETLTIVNNDNAPIAEKDRTVEQVMTAFEAYCNPKKNETVERHKFFTRSQASGETFDEYLTELRTLAAECGFGAIKDSLIRDRILCGISDGKVRERLLRESDLSLKKCGEICRAAEVSRRSIQTMKNSEDIVHYAYKPGKARAKKQAVPQTWKTSSAGSCSYCAKKHPPGRDACPAYGKECSACGKPNHFARACKSADKKQPRKMGKAPGQYKKKTAVHAVEDEDHGDFLMTINDERPSPENAYAYGVNANSYAKQVYATMKVEGKSVRFQLDLGATCNVMPRKVLKKHNISYQVDSNQRTLTMYNDTSIKSDGETMLKMINPRTKKKYCAKFVVVDGDGTPLLGSRSIQQMGIVTVHYNKIQVVQSNGSRLDKPITREGLIEEYKDVFTGLGRLPGECHLEVDESIKPRIHPPRRVPVSIKEQLKRALDDMTEEGVIEPVTTPTPWVSSLVTVSKPSGKLRICIDPRDLNEALKRSHYPAPTIDDLTPELRKAKVFSVLDAKNGYWQVVLDEESSLLTTFNTPQGRFKWKRLPFGIKSSPEEFQRRLDQALEGLAGVKPVVDDILVWGEGETLAEATTDHDRNLRTLMQRCRERNLKLNQDKIKLRMQEVPFHGHLITSQGLKLDPGKVAAIAKMPRPTDAQAVQRLIGFVTYLAKFLPKLSDVCEPLRKLTVKDSEFEWLDAHEKILETLKELVSTAPVLKYYDPTEELTLQTDASSTGLGAAIMQNGQPVAYASRALTDAETRYAQIEKEMLGVVFGLERFHQYTYGREVKVQTDHKPLEMIVLKPLHAAPRRLQRMLMRLQQYNVTIAYKPGSELYLADTLSRAYLPLEEKRSKTELETEQVNMVDELIMSSPTIEDIQRHTENDQEMQKLKQYIRDGFPEKGKLPASMVPYFHVRDQLAFQNGTVFKGQCAVVPKTLRYDMLKRLHASHMGTDASLRHAKECIYWPGMSAQVKDYVEKCDVCQAMGIRQQKETLIPHPVTQRPWEKVGIDLFTLHGREYVITVDYYSNYFEIDTCETDTRATTIVRKLKMQFARHGIPDIVMTDNGPQFASSEFDKFAQEWNFQHQTSSPGYPQSNGKVENAVKTAKRLMEKAKLAQADPYLALLDFRNTPTQEIGSSPAQRLFSRRTKTTLPMKTTLLEPKVQSNIPRKLHQAKQRQRKYYNRGARDMPPLNVGDTVRCEPNTHRTKQWKRGKVVADLGGRSYEVETEDGGKYRRNRRHLRQSKETPTVADGMEIENHTPAETTMATTPAAEPTVEGAAEQQTTTRSGRTVRPPAHLKDYVRE